MQSPIGVFLRVLAMMGCLIVVPLTAMFGTTAISNVANLVFDGPWSAKSASARESGPERQPAGEPSGRSALPTIRQSVGERESQAVPATLVRQATTDGTSEIRPIAMTPAAASGPPDSSRQSDAELIRAALTSRDGKRPVSDAESGMPAALRGDPRLAAIEQRLRDLGATHYRLESWGGDGRLYRFSCSMSVAESREWNRLFEATDSDPLRAAGAVMDDVEAWRAGVR